MFKNRVKNVQAVLREEEAFLVESLPNRFYLTGFMSSAGTVLITKRSAWFFIDFRYVEKAGHTIDSCKVVEAKRLLRQIGEVLERENIRSLWVEADSMSISQYKTYAEHFAGIEVLTLNKMDHIMQDMRMIKTGEELDRIRTAQQMTDDTFKYILPRIRAGRTEREIMLDMEFYMRSLGSEGVSFDFIVVSGKNSSMPHGVPTDKKVEKGDFITMDFGAVYMGYHSDMTRTVAVGNISEKQKQVYDTVLQAQQLALEAIRPGKSCKEIDGTAREYIYSKGYEGCFGHGLGHSVGVEIHEMPAFNTRCETIIKPGMIMTVEPGIYLENQFGVRIEDMVSITQDGILNLTESSKELIQL